MAKRMFGLYVLVEMVALVALTQTIGLGWTLLLVLATFAAGLVLAGSQLKRQVQRLRSRAATPARDTSDGVLIALGTVLTVVPGLVTSVFGLLLLFPLTRLIVRPVVAPLAARALGRMPLRVATTSRSRPVSYVDGEVLDVTDVAPGPTAPTGPAVPTVPTVPPRNLPVRPV